MIPLFLDFLARKKWAVMDKHGKKCKFTLCVACEHARATKDDYCNQCWDEFCEEWEKTELMTKDEQRDYLKKTIAKAINM